MVAIAHKSAGTTERQLVTFRLGELLLGIDIRCVREINRVFDITPVPDAPPLVTGVVNLRGEVVTVVDLRTILELPATEITPRTRLMIVQSDDEAIGLLVDRVADVATVQSTDEEPLPANVGGIDSRYFTGVYRVGNDLLVVLDVAAALALADN
jgi:purine-binding chemotaxis protein CheW